MRYHREQLPKVMREVPLADLRALCMVAPPVVDFVGALKQPSVSLIAECKKASPSKGLLVPKYDPAELARSYVLAGASAVSVLTDGRYFQGSLEDLRDVKEAISNLKPAEWKSAIGAKGPRKKAPILRKDFIFHPYQLYEARAAGADAVLLIAAVLERSEIKELLQLTHELGMEALVEVHTEEELEKALTLGPRVLGVNNRNLQTFEVDFENTGRLRNLIPKELVMVGESGIRTAEDIRRMAEIGVDAVLVGEALVKSKDIPLMTQYFVRAGKG